MCLQLGDGRLQLIHRGADVGQLDDIGGCFLGQVAKLAKRIRNALLGREVVTELGEDAGGDRDIALFDIDPGRCGEGFNDRQQRLGGQQRRFVGKRVDDRRAFSVHGVGVLNTRQARIRNGERSAASGNRILEIGICLATLPSSGAFQGRVSCRALGPGLTATRLTGSRTTDRAWTGR